MRDAPFPSQTTAPPPTPIPALQDVHAVVFDFDGTLARLTIDFEHMKDRAAHAGAPHLPHLLNPGRPAASIDGPVLEWLEAHAPHAERLRPGGGEALRAAVMDAVTAVEREAASRGALFPFTRPLLTQLRERGVGVAVITRNCREAVFTLFPDLLEHATALFTREDVPAVKPHPGHLLTALAALKTPPTRALMVGDHPSDVETGVNAGVRVGGVASGRTSMAALAAAGATVTAPDAAALLSPLTGPLSVQQSDPQSGPQSGKSGAQSIQGRS